MTIVLFYSSIFGMCKKMENTILPFKSLVTSVEIN